jgi:nucleotide-binding universal stress UspA family protein
MYDRILVPLENSPADETILAHVRALARIHHSRLLLIHVADGWAARHQEQFNLEDSEEIRADRAYLDSRRAELAAEGFDTAVVLAKGDPAREILAVAHREQCDLIAMTTHGHGFLQDLVLGSVASDVRHKTDIPVLLVRRSRG